MSGQRKDFVAAKFLLIEAAADDDRLSRLDLRVHCKLLTRYVNGETGLAWPSPKTLADGLGADRRSVRRSLKRLSKTWWRQVEKGGPLKGEFNRTSRYEPLWQMVTDKPLFDSAADVGAHKPLPNPTVGTNESTSRGLHAPNVLVYTPLGVGV